MANYLSRSVLNGLGTFPIAVPTAATYLVSGTISLPTISQGNVGNSQIVVTININGGSTVYTGAVGAEGFSYSPTVSAGDIINIILTSSAAVDQGLNKIKTTISISEQ